MTVRYATTDEVARWDELLIINPDGGNVFQAAEMAETKHHNGWTPRYVMANNLAITVLEKGIPLLGTFWYMPKGPGVTSPSDLLAVLDELKEFAHKQRVFVIKIEPEILESVDADKTLQSAGLVPAPAIQPNHSTVIVDLAPSIDEIMASFNQKGRNALRRAEREGVTTYAVSLNDSTAHAMYELLASTAAGRFDGSLRSYAYYIDFWGQYVTANRGSLFFAEYDGVIVASAFCMYLGKKGLYKDGASVRQKTVYGASHLLQWEVMKWMKERGVESYDLCATPHSSLIDDANDPFHGIGRFKTSFNKHVTDYVGCYDIVVRPSAYRLWKRYAERAILSLSWRIKQRQWY